MNNKKNVRANQIVDKNNLLWLSGILLLTFFTFYPSLKNGFTNWDDNVYIAENPLITSLSGDNVKKILETDNPVALNYHPITILSFAIDHQLSGYNPKTYHTTNLLFHLLNTALVFWFIFLLSGRKLVVATIVALFFGIHPMHVESVAWISERKDVLYTFFFMASLICYYKYIHANNKNKYLLYFFTIVLFLLSVLSKAMAVVFPLVLVLTDYYEGRKLNKYSVFEKLPFFILSLFFGVLAYQIQSKGAAIAALETFTWLQRFEFASYGMLNYIFKLFIPLNLSCFYPYPDSQQSLPIMYFISPFIVLALFAFVLWNVWKKKSSVTFVFGLLFFCITIVLVLQLITVGKVIMADRYSYLAYVGLLFPIAMGYEWLQEQKNQNIILLKKIAKISLIIYAVVFIFLSFQRTKVWKNSDTLWSDALDKYPNSEAYHSRASYLVNKSAIDKGQKNVAENEYDRALSDFSKAIQLKTLDASIYTGRANIYSLKGQFDSALTDYSKAIQLNPSDAQTYLNRAGAYILMKQFDKAIIDYTKALTLNPNLIEARKNRSYVYGQIGNYERSVIDLNEIIRQYPANADYYFYRSFAYYKMNKYILALEDNNMSMQLNPDKNSLSYYNRSLINKALGKYKDALGDALKAQRLGYKVDERYINELKAY